MANTVTDKIESWQNDADALDTNPPVAATAMGTSTVGDLAGELRRLKSELRDVSLALSWNDWKGLKSNITGNIAFTYISANSFSVNDNMGPSNRNELVIGRRIKALLPTSTPAVVYATIAGVVEAGGVTVTLDHNCLTNTLSNVLLGLHPSSFSAFPGSVVSSSTDFGPITSASGELGITGMEVASLVTTETTKFRISFAGTVETTGTGSNPVIRLYADNGTPVVLQIIRNASYGSGQFNFSFTYVTPVGVIAGTWRFYLTLQTDGNTAKVVGANGFQLAVERL